MRLSMIAVALLSAPALAGPLNPPAGPVTPTPGPEPRTPIGPETTPGDPNASFIISQPGSYYLTGNFIGEIMKHGIVIQSDDVSIDLMGFTLQGISGSQDGISSAGAARHRIRIVNGTIRQWGGSGIGLAGGVAHHVRNIFASGNGASGIDCHQGAIIDSCVAWSNGAQGIECGRSSVIRSCSALENGVNGIVVSDSGMTGESGPGAIINCVASANGFDGFNAGVGCSIVNCAANNNVSDGFAVSTVSSIDACAAVANGSDGIRTGGGCAISACASGFNGEDGIDTDRSSVVGCAARANSGSGIDSFASSTITDCVATENDAAGIATGNGCIITECALWLNLQGIQTSESIVSRCNAIGSNLSGINAADNSLVDRCIAKSNTFHGVFVSFNSVVTGCLLSANGGGFGDDAGVLAEDQNNRIDGNHFTNNEFAVILAGNENILIRNTFLDNSTNLSLSGSHLIGPTFNVTGASGINAWSNLSDQ